jgi:hypothetical protein
LFLELFLEDDAEDVPEGPPEDAAEGPPEDAAEDAAEGIIGEGDTDVELSKELRGEKLLLRENDFEFDGLRFVLHETESLLRLLWKVFEEEEELLPL